MILKIRKITASVQMVIIALLIIGSLGSPIAGMAQQHNSAEVSISMVIPPVALINFVSNERQLITYSYSNMQFQEVEQVITPTTGDKTWVNYSSIVGPGLSNYITVHISSGSLPADVVLTVYVSDDIGAGEGSTGTSVGNITLSSYPQNIITNIGSCYTGEGVNKGHQLIYMWENPDSYSYNLNYENGKAIAVTYTITSTE